MKIFSMDSPLMTVLNKVADLMWLNILTMLCCIPIVTAGASFTAMHYMALKIVRDEECYITRGFFKSFKENFKQATIIWFIMAAVIFVIAGDYYIILESGINFHLVLRIMIMAISVLVLFEAVFVFPVLAKFDNTVKHTLKNAFVISILQFPKTILMIIMTAFPVIIVYLSVGLFPIAFLFGLSFPAYVSALLYNKFFKKLENQILAETSDENAEEDEDERIFKDELDENLHIQ